MGGFLFLRPLDVAIPDDANAVGKTVAQLQLPKEAVLVSIRRGSAVLIPHGDTLLQACDVVTALCAIHCSSEVAEVFQHPIEEE